MSAETQLLMNLKNTARNQTYIEIIKQRHTLLICTSDVVIEDEVLIFCINLSFENLGQNLSHTVLLKKRKK